MVFNECSRLICIYRLSFLYFYLLKINFEYICTAKSADSAYSQRTCGFKLYLLLKKRILMPACLFGGPYLICCFTSKVNT